MPTETSSAAPATPGVVENDSSATAQIRREQRRLAWRILAVLSLLTALVTGANAWLLYRSTPAPYALSYEGSYNPTAGETFGLVLEWDVPPASFGASVIRPVLLLDGKTPIPDSPGTSLLPVDVSRLHHLSVVVPGDATRGTHRGRLLLRPPGTRPGLPPESTQDIAVEVIGGFWQSWFLLRNWLFVVATAFALLWTFCILVFPRPSGTVRFERRFEEGGHKREVRLSSGLRGWLLPFDRSTVHLLDVFRVQSIRDGGFPDGDILFVFPGTPPVLLIETGTRSQLQKAYFSGTVPEDAAFEPCGTRETMRPDRLFRYAGSRGTEPMFFRYAPPRMLG